LKKANKSIHFLKFKLFFKEPYFSTATAIANHEDEDDDTSQQDNDTSHEDDGTIQRDDGTIRQDDGTIHEDNGIYEEENYTNQRAQNKQNWISDLIYLAKK
jgi:hypothetical protein